MDIVSRKPEFAAVDAGMKAPDQLVHPRNLISDCVVRFLKSILWRSHNAEKVTHFNGRLLYKAMILYNYVTFENGSFS